MGGRGKVYEVIRDDVGGKVNIIGKGWATDDQIAMMSIRPQLVGNVLRVCPGHPQRLRGRSARGTYSIISKKYKIQELGFHYHKKSVSAIDPRLALLNPVGRPQKRHDAIRELTRDLDGARRHRRDVERNRPHLGLLREMGRRACGSAA